MGSEEGFHMAMPAEQTRPRTNRRAVAREHAGWSGTYGMKPVRTVRRGDCIIANISVLGAGLELLGTTGDDILGCRLVVEIVAPGSVALRLSGDIKYVNPGSQGGVRVGIEFAGLSEV